MQFMITHPKDHRLRTLGLAQLWVACNSGYVNQTRELEHGALNCKGTR